MKADYFRVRKNLMVWRMPVLHSASSHFHLCSHAAVDPAGIEGWVWNTLAKIACGCIGSLRGILLGIDILSLFLSIGRALDVGFRRSFGPVGATFETVSLKSIPRPAFAVA